MNTNVVPNKALYERCKLALIPVLGLVFMAVMFWPSQPKSASSPAELAINNAIPKSAPLSPKVWPTATWEDVTAFNPFDPPPRPAPTEKSPSEATAHDSQPEPDSVEAPNIQAIYADQRGTIAIVDSRVVRVGDLLGGRRIVAISANGLTLEDSAPSQ
jgi:hypothetical protein